MSKPNNNRIILTFISAILSVVVIFASFMIGYGVGASKASKNSDNKKEKDNASEMAITGTYNRSFSNNYNNSMESYVVLKNNGSCKYISSIKSENAATVDLDTMDEKCSFSYDKNTGTGRITIKSHYIENGEKVDSSGVLKFSFKSGTLILGGASYSKIK